MVRAMNGNSLTLTEDNGVTGRELVVSDPAVIRLLTGRFVPETIENRTEQKMLKNFLARITPAAYRQWRTRR